MAYSEKLIKEVKACYPDYEKMHQLADEGSVWLGRYLDDSSSMSIHAERILAATSLHELKEEAGLAIRKRECYKMWCNEDPRRV